MSAPAVRMTIAGAARNPATAPAPGRATAIARTATTTPRRTGPPAASRPTTRTSRPGDGPPLPRPRRAAGVTTPAVRAGPLTTITRTSTPTRVTPAPAIVPARAGRRHPLRPRARAGRGSTRASAMTTTTGRAANGSRSPTSSTGPNCRPTSRSRPRPGRPASRPARPSPRRPSAAPGPPERAPPRGWTARQSRPGPSHGPPAAPAAHPNWHLRSARKAVSRAPGGNAQRSVRP